MTTRTLDDAEARMAVDPSVLPVAMGMAERQARRWGCDPDALKSDVAYRLLWSAMRYRPGPRSWRSYALANTRLEMLESRRRDARAGFTGYPLALRSERNGFRSVENLGRDDIPAARDAESMDGAEEILSSLDPRSRRVVEAVVLDGYRKADVADQLGLSRARVTNIYEAAIEHLRDRWAGRIGPGRCG